MAKYRKGCQSSHTRTSRLAYLVKTHFELDPFSGQVFLFCGGRKDRFKALYWDGQGFWLLYKRFENGRLTWSST
ncbi:IS66 family insertion sequence element accessory protein TnpB [Streptococcus pneumoniae]|uniref:IS66 family insertion sequence element accessory protein TnpB n=1 Tax=Streptococcus pneumoniae TaxID=1313 RepID=UPI001877A606